MKPSPEAVRNFLLAVELHSPERLRGALPHAARADVLLPGITRGRGFAWESTFFDVTPISYAPIGLLPQVHRREPDVAADVRTLLEATGRLLPPLRNIPNRCLQGDAR